MAERSKATDRLMSVFAIITQHGPISLADLTQASSLPRSSVHRACQALQTKGWIRARLSDHRYEISHQFQTRVANAPQTVHCTALLDDTLKDLASSTDLIFEIGVFTQLGQFDGVDTTEYKFELEQDQSLTSTPGALFAQLAMPTETVIKHLDEYFKTALDTEKYQISSGRHRKRLEILRRTGHAATPPYLMFPFSIGNMEYGSVLVKRPLRTSLKPQAWTPVQDMIWERLSDTKVTFTQLNTP